MGQLCHLCWAHHSMSQPKREGSFCRVLKGPKRFPAGQEHWSPKPGDPVLCHHKAALCQSHSSARKSLIPLWQRPKQLHKFLSGSKSSLLLSELQANHCENTSGFVWAVIFLFNTTYKSHVIFSLFLASIHTCSITSTKSLTHFLPPDPCSSQTRSDWV